ncbi:MAG: sugar phosphate isomerase/epimerase [Chloroflexi bacterium]|nr:sugar phosphate isomerase/epimerase [Chloroflexota bacterium]
MAFKLGYSTYALHMVDPFEALQKIRQTGYDNLEVCVSDDWPTAPRRFGAGSQRKLATLSKSLGFPSPILFGGIDVCAREGERAAMMEKTLAKFEMAKALHYDDTPVLITTTAGQHRPGWEQGKTEIRDAFLRLGDAAARHGVTIAVEAHAGTDFETPEKAVWMMEHTRHPNLKLDLDISHFVVEGADMDHSVDICAPYSVMVHVKEGRKVDGEVQFRLTGEGLLDLPAFLRALTRNGLERLPVYAEVSVQQSRRPDYHPWRTAKFCYDALDRGRKTAAA